MEPYPFLKWAGGKGQLLAQFADLYPTGAPIRGYIEPFVGSGAVFFDVRRLLHPRKVVLSDGNEDLVQAYRAVQQDVESVIRHLRRHEKLHSKEHYYRVRARNPRRMEPAPRAARLIYLNRTCFNGLYRVNSKGEFNVPMGRYVKPSILDAENLRAVSVALRGTRIEAAHFRKVLDWAREGDFVYLDPPYDPLSSTSYFTSYTDRSFGEEDQRELARVYEELAARGCLVMLSNSDTRLVRELYAGFEVRQVLARRAINSRADRRGPIRELVVLDYVPSRDGRGGPTPFARRPRRKKAVARSGAGARS